MGCKICKYEDKKDNNNLNSLDFEAFFNEIEYHNGNPDKSNEDKIPTIKAKPIKKMEFFPEDTTNCSSKDYKLEYANNLTSLKSINNKDIKEISLEKYDDENNSNRGISYDCFMLKFVNLVTKNIQKLSITPNIIEEASEGRFLLGGTSSNSLNNFDIQDENIVPKQLSIKYESNEYILTERKQSTGLFLKINNKLAIDKNTVVVFSSYQIFISLEVDNEHQKANTSYGNNYGHSQLYRKINIKFLSLPNHSKHSIKEFSFSSRNKALVKVGRSKSCEISFPKDEKISRVHCCFIYENNGWVLYDGDQEKYKNLDKDKLSTNGIWKLITEKITIFDGMELKIGNTAITANKVKEENIK